MKRMSDFELLKNLQLELVNTLEKRRQSEGEHVRREFCRAKIRRLRLEISEIMLRIERKCVYSFLFEKEEWQ